MTLVIHKDNAPLHVQQGVDEMTMGYIVDQYCADNNTDPNAVTAELIAGDYTFNMFVRYKSISAGAIIDREETASEAKEKSLREVAISYTSISSGTAPTTGQNIYVDCLTANGTYRMNAGKDAAANMDYGYQLTVEAGLTEMPIVRDFNNVNHVNVPTAVANQIRLQQGQDALAHWQRKGELVDAINACTTVEEVEAIEITFNVNTA